MNLNEISKRMNGNKIISIMICVLLVFTLFLGTYVQSYAFVPAVVLAGKGAVVLLTLLAGGYAISDGYVLQMTTNEIMSNLTQEQSDYLENNYQDWSANEKINISKEKLDEIQLIMQGMQVNNQLTLQLMSGNMVAYTTPTNVPLIYMKNVAYNAFNIEAIRGFCPKVMVTYDGVWLSDQIKVSRAYYDTSTRDCIKISYYDDAGQLSQTETLQNFKFSRVYPIYFNGFIRETNGYPTLTFYGTNYSSGAEERVTGVNLSNTAGRKIGSSAVEFLNSITTPQITYNVYNPPVNGNNEVDIPWPAGLTWQDLIGKSGADVFDLPNNPGTQPGETGKDYTGLFGTVIAWLQSIANKLSEIMSSIGTWFATLIADLSNPFNWEKTPKGPSFLNGISGFFAVLLALLLAIMHLIAKVIAFIGQLYSIPASTAMIHPTMLQGIEWARGFHTSSGVNLYGLVTGVISIVLGIVCFKILRKLITGIGAASPFEDNSVKLMSMTDSRFK